MDDIEAPLICARKGCHQVVRFSNTELCEDCWADQANKYHGKAQNAKTLIGGSPSAQMCSHWAKLAREDAEQSFHISED